MTQSDLSPSNCLERKKATGAIFEYATRGYLHLAAVAPSATTALATKEPALRQIPHGLGNTRGTINVKMLLRAIQILSHLEYGPVSPKPAQLPGAKKKTRRHLRKCHAGLSASRRGGVIGSDSIGYKRPPRFDRLPMGSATLVG